LRVKLLAQYRLLFALLRANLAITRATHHMACLVGHATFGLLTELYSDGSNFCIRTRIGTIFISKSTVSTRMFPLKVVFGFITLGLALSSHVLTPDFGTVNNLFKMASNGEVIFMKEFRIVDMNIFEVWVIAVRFHLEGRNYAQSTKILYSEYSLAD